MTIEHVLLAPMTTKRPSAALGTQRTERTERVVSRMSVIAAAAGSVVAVAAAIAAFNAPSDELPVIAAAAAVNVAVVAPPVGPSLEVGDRPWVLSAVVLSSEMTGPALYEAAELSTALILVPGGSGSASLIGCTPSGMGLFLTNHHVVQRGAAGYFEETDVLVVNPADATSVRLRGSVTVTDPAYDLALIEVPLANVPALRGLRLLTIVDPAPPGDRIGVPTVAEWEQKLIRQRAVTAGFPHGGSQITPETVPRVT